VTVGLQLAAQVMGTYAGFHANQARRHVGKPRFDLAT
jgi:predicted hotdog family 3-hydroxylacyl-ACP dehydratase